MRLAFFDRRPSAFGTYSIEQIFETMRTALPADVHASVFTSRFVSVGVLGRLYNIVEAAWRQRGADVNHVTGDIHYVTLLLRKRKTVLTVHDCGFELHPSRWRRAVIRWLWLRIPASRAAAVITDSEFSRRRILALSGCDPAKVSVAPVCVSRAFRPVDKAFDRERPTVLHVGTTVNKNLERVCDALDGLPCRFVVVGKLSDQQRRLLESSGLDWSNRSGLSDEGLVGVYAEADLVVFASTYEGFGLPIVEAQIVGRPVVTSDVASMPEVAGDGACFVDPFDPESIRGGIRRLIEDDAFRNDLVERGSRNARRFSAETTARGYLAVYQQVAGTGRG